MTDCVYTIGHSSHPIGKFIDLLRTHGVSAIADVRSHPYSRFNPQFNRETLQAELGRAGLAYVFLGRELGARPEDAGCYVEGAVRYDLLARTRLFQEGLARVAESCRAQRLALMCAEKDPLQCHRAILVCRHLALEGIAAQHILADGRLESHEVALGRLLAEVGSDAGELFRSRDERIADAYDQRGEQIAHTTREGPAEGTAE